MKIVVSACLMGESCKYNGLDNYHRELVEACERTGTEVLLVCPEVFGGLPTPRKPSEIVNGEVRTCEGISVDREFRLGAQRALDMCEQAGGPEEMPRASFRTAALVRAGPSTTEPSAVRSPRATVFSSTCCCATGTA
ncbi:MAG: DUF523 domain-containing protein [Collinsella sp.]